MKKLVYALVALVLIVEIAVIVSGRSLLVWQHTVRPGEKYILEDYGDIGKAGGKSLASTTQPKSKLSHAGNNRSQANSIRLNLPESCRLSKGHLS
jgi:hypothetical protein